MNKKKFFGNAAPQALDLHDVDQRAKMTRFPGFSASNFDHPHPLRIRPNLLVVPPAYRQAAHELVQREYLQNGESNPLYKIVDVLVSPWL